jgi:tetratricopeptide (TPR) repeat protein
VERFRGVVTILCLGSLAGLGGSCSKTASTDHDENSVCPFYSGLGHYGRRTATSSQLAQRYFDQGLAFLYAFNRDEALRSFEEAAKIDPGCAIFAWGIAAANGANINDPSIDEPHARAAFAAAQTARQLSSRATPVERALIEAICERCGNPEGHAGLLLDQAYAAAMVNAWREFPHDPDVGSLAAAALLQLRPRDQWTRDGKPQAGTTEAIRIIDSVLAVAPDHPLALHLLVHAYEAAPHPELADAAADRLRTLQPGLGHILHMPSHIDVRCGRWLSAIHTNENAVVADHILLKRLRRPGDYLPYVLHNYHMLAYAAMMQGTSEQATRAVSEMLGRIPEGCENDQAQVLDGYFALPYEVHLRFGRWDDILRMPPPRATFRLATALWRFGRSLAFGAKHQVERAREEQRAFHAACGLVPGDAVFHYTPALEILVIADKMLEGELLYREHRTDEALAILHEAVHDEDDLRYLEPPNWLVPVRHALGATLMDAGRPAEAEAVYREDLLRHPDNGWALYGLWGSLRVQGKRSESAEVLSRFRRVWKYADCHISSSCCCLPGNDSSMIK